MSFGPTGDKGSAGTSNGLGPRTVIAKIAKTNISQAELDTMLAALATGGTFSGVDNDPFTIAGVCASSDAGVTWGAFADGASDIVSVALQGTGTINADSSNALGVTGAALTVEGDY
tara:strand:+ start:62 stop:409 length:348 start_codon:yes stop_codon:yes gene_type:complete